MLFSFDVFLCLREPYCCSCFFVFSDTALAIPGKDFPPKYPHVLAIPSRRPLFPGSFSGCLTPFVPLILCSVPAGSLMPLVLRSDDALKKLAQSFEAKHVFVGVFLLKDFKDVSAAGSFCCLVSSSSLLSSLFDQSHFLLSLPSQSPPLHSRRFHHLLALLLILLLPHRHQPLLLPCWIGVGSST